MSGNRSLLGTNGRNYNRLSKDPEADKIDEETYRGSGFRE